MSNQRGRLSGGINNATLGSNLSFPFLIIVRGPKFLFVIIQWIRYAGLFHARLEGRKAVTTLRNVEEWEEMISRDRKFVPTH